MITPLCLWTLWGLPCCLAYVGPGPGLTMVWALAGLFLTLFAAFLAIALWPIRALLRRRREKRGDATLSESS